MIATCQRWRDGRARYRPAGEVFDTSRAAVHELDESTAKAFTERHHYAGTYPAARFRAGLFVQDRFTREQLVGVAVFSHPTHEAIIPNHFNGLKSIAGVVLGRLVLLDEIAANAESWFVARAFRLLRGIDGVLSYSDPVERVDAAGNVVKRGHVGTVYQALNAFYRGRTRARQMILSGSGREIQLRTLSKLRNDEIGAGYAYDQLRALGAPERRPLEGGADYIARALAEGGFRKQRHPGNHTYAWWIGDKRKRPAWSPAAYPRAA